MQLSQGFGYCINKFTGGVNDKNRKIPTSQIFDDGTPSICVCKSIDARFFVSTDLLPLAQRLHARLLLFYDPSRTQRFAYIDDSLIQFFETRLGWTNYPTEKGSPFPLPQFLFKGRF
jgi:hypothetical protein